MTFEEYLQQKHMEQYRGVDDDAPDDYERWVSNLYYENFIKYAEEWREVSLSTIRREAYLQGAKDAIEAMKLVTPFMAVNEESYGYNLAVKKMKRKAQQFIDSLEKGE